MDQRGIAPLVIVAIVVVVAVVAGAGIYVATRGGDGGGLGSLPKYPGSQSWNIPSEYSAGIPAGTDYAGYTVSVVSVQDVLDWYRGQMTDWTVVEDNVPVKFYGSMTVYRKGDNGAVIAAISGSGLPGTCYILATGPWWSVLQYFVGGLGGGAVTPSATLSVTAAENSPGSTWVTLTIEHNGGEALALSDIEIIAATSTGTVENVLTAYPGITGTLTVGHSITLSYDYGASCVGQTIRVQLIHVPSSQILYSNAGVLVASA
jgi:hypothetical protein